MRGLRERATRSRARERRGARLPNRRRQGHRSSADAREARRDDHAAERAVLSVLDREQEAARDAHDLFVRHDRRATAHATLNVAAVTTRHRGREPLDHELVEQHERSGGRRRAAAAPLQAAKLHFPNKSLFSK